jgi:hypothetical protein
VKNLILIILIVFPVSAWATDWTVKASGGDYTDIDDCVNAVSAGDRCIVDPGNYGDQTITNSGSTDSYIEIVASVLEDESNYTVDELDLTNESWVSIEGFSMDERPSCNGCSFIRFRPIVINHTAAAFGREGGGSCGSSYYLCGDDILFEDIYATGHHTNDAYKGNGDRWVIRNSFFEDYADDVGAAHIDFHQVNCSQFTTIESVLVENVLATDWGDDGDAHFVFENCSSGDVENYIVRYNKINVMAGSTVFGPYANVVDYVGYNNTIVDAGSEATHIGYLAGSTGDRYFQNNIYYDTLSRTSARGINTTQALCGGSLVYDPDGSVTLQSSYCLDSSDSVVNGSDPKFTNLGSNDFTLQSDSNAIDNGVHLTQANGSSGGSPSTSLVVDSAAFFQDGWAGVNPDCIAIGTVSNTACIAAGTINIGTGAMTLDTPLTWSDDAYIWLYKRSDGTVVLHGTAPDSGAEEYEDTGTVPGMSTGGSASMY